MFLRTKYHHFPFLILVCFCISPQAWSNNGYVPRLSNSYLPTYLLLITIVISILPSVAHRERSVLEFNSGSERKRSASNIIMSFVTVNTRHVD